MELLCEIAVAVAIFVAWDSHETFSSFLHPFQNFVSLLIPTAAAGVVVAVVVVRSWQLWNDASLTVRTRTAILVSCTGDNAVGFYRIFCDSHDSVYTNFWQRSNR